MKENFNAKNWEWTEELDEEFQDGYNSEGYDENGFGPDGLDEFGFDRNQKIKIGPFELHRSDFNSEPDDYLSDMPELRGSITIKIPGLEDSVLNVTLWKRELVIDYDDGTYCFNTENFGKHFADLLAGDAVIEDEDCLTPMLVFDLWLRADCSSTDEYESRGGKYYSHGRSGYSF